MKIRDKILVQKYYLNVFNGIFLALGLMTLTFGLWLLLDRNNLFSLLLSSGKNRLVASLSWMLLGTGSVITFVSAMGCLGSIREIKCLLVIYMTFHLLVFVTQMAISVLIFVKKGEVHSEWYSRIDEVISDYGNESLAEQEPVWNILNAVQHNMECCGRYNVTQWEGNKNKENSTQIPCSCTRSQLKKWFCDVPRDLTYTMGCEEHLKVWFENNVVILTAITLSLPVTQIFLIKLTSQLLRNIRKNNIWPNQSSTLEL
ncbi:tetraspanin-19 [Dryobates pubescens]|uniref:tetraspanin-19 n=1 Tax=Dryobates pubescens TaxID=118200 RepID=UPI0023B92CF1|nr:tetraspanin-19 [Dryobates pubescens]